MIKSIIQNIINKPLNLHKKSSIEAETVNHLVAGSNPAQGAIFQGLTSHIIGTMYDRIGVV